MKKIFIILLNIALFAVVYYFLDYKFSIKLDNIQQQLSSISGDTSGLTRINGDFQSNIIAGVSKIEKSVVSINTIKKLKFFKEDMDFFDKSLNEADVDIGGGAGIIVSKDGYILTNRHVVEDLKLDYKAELYDGKTLNIEKIWLDDQKDIALLKVQLGDVNLNNYFSPSMFTSGKVGYKGEIVFSMGNILSKYKNSLVWGIISEKGVDIDVNSKIHYTGLYLVDMLTNPGNSGGPLFNIDGNVIGIVTASNTFDKGLGFAIPINKVDVDNIISKFVK